MYLFTRRAHARAGDLTKSMAWATGITDRVHQITGLDVSLYSGVFGPEVGTLVWSVVVPDLLTLEAAQDKLAADAGYLEEASKGQQFAPDGAHDRLLSIIHPTEPAPQAAGAPQPSYAVVVDAVCATGSVARGMELGVRIAQKAEEISGVTTVFAADTNGSFGGVTWITGYRDVQELERAEQSVLSNPEFLAMLDQELPGVYIEDAQVTRQRTYRRML